MKQLLAAFLMAVSLASCRDIIDPELRGIDNVKINWLGFSNTTVALDIKYFNPNHFKAKLKEAEGDAWMDSIFLGHFNVDTIVSVPANSEFLVPVNLAIDMKYLIQNSLAVFTNQEVLISITGTAKAGRHGIYKSFPLKYEGKQNLGKLLKM